MDKGVIVIMDAYWDDIFASVLEGDRVCIAESKKAMGEAERSHRRLLELVGEEEGDKLWSDAVLAGCAEALPSFRAGLRFGLRLLALCMETD